LAKDIDIDVFLFGDYIMGITSSYLEGKDIDLDKINLHNELDRRLDDCLEKLKDLKRYKQRINKLANLLVQSSKST